MNGELTDLIILVVLILASAAFSAAEISVVSLSPAKIRTMKEDKKFASSALVKLKSKPQKLLVSILIGIQGINVIATVIATFVGVVMFGEARIGIFTAVFTAIIIIFGSLLPKSLALKNPELIARILAYPLLAFVLIIRPLSWISEKIINLFTKSDKKKNEEITSISPQEIEAMLDISSEEGVIEEEQEQLIKQILKFQETEVEDIMTLLKDINAINKNIERKELQALLEENAHTAYPIFDEDLNNIVGEIRLEKILEILFHKRNKYPLKSFKKQKITIIPKTNSLAELLKIFKTSNSYIAVVVDEHGQTIGLITLNNILAEISKLPISDKAKKKEEEIIKKGNLWEADGKCTIDKINQKLDIKLDFDEHETIALYVLEKLKRFPEKNEILKGEKVEIEVLKVSEKTIDLVQIKKLNKKRK